MKVKIYDKAGDVFTKLKTYAYSNGELLKEFESRKDAAKFFGINQSRVSSSIRDRSVSIIKKDGQALRIAFRNYLISKP